MAPGLSRVYRSVLSFVESTQLQFDTFTPNHVKPLSFVLRGLDVDFPLGDILDELRELSYPVCSIFRVYAPVSPKRLYPLGEDRGRRKTTLVNAAVACSIIATGRLCTQCLTAASGSSPMAACGYT